MSSYTLKPTDKLSVYIDGGNLFHCGDALGWRIDYLKFKSFVLQGRTPVDFTFYTGRAQSRAEQKFYQRLRAFGYTVKEFKLQIRPGGGRPKEKRVDTQIVADSLYDAFTGKFDIAAICSGDGDMIPAIEYLKIMGKRVEIFAYRSGLSWDIRTSGVSITDLTANRALLER